MIQNFTGLDDLRAQLESNGWRIYQNHLGSDGNACDWIACMKGPEDAPDCELNNKPPQFVVTPYHIKFEGHESKSAQVDMTGEAGGQWFKLQAYSIPASELLARLPEAKARLAAAWSAIGKAEQMGCDLVQRDGRSAVVAALRARLQELEKAA